jgi:acyl carrier protein
MTNIEELKALMLEAGLDKNLVTGLDPLAPLALQGADSMDFPVLVAAVEDHYGITISDEDALKLKTLSDFENFINIGINCKTA